MRKLTKEEYALKNNLNPDDFKDSKEIAKFLNYRDRLHRHWATVLLEQTKEYLKIENEWSK